jgi:predicted ATP-grasp superfamily ATP-dependent carboligase
MPSKPIKEDLPNDDTAPRRPILGIRTPSLWIIGGSVRAAAIDAARGGYKVVASDHFGDADLLAACDRWLPIKQAGHWPQAIDAPDATVVPTGGFQWPDETGEDTANAGKADASSLTAGGHRGLIAFPPRETFDAIRDPAILRAIAERCGVGFPVTLAARDTDAFRPPPGSDWLVKPLRGTGGIGIRRWRNADAESSAGTISPDECLQQRILGRPIGVNFFSRLRDGVRHTVWLGTFAGLINRKNSAHPWLYGGSIGPLSDHAWPPSLALSPRERAKITRLGETIADEFDLVGLFNVDLIRRTDGTPVMLEINPRYSASMELLTDGHFFGGSTRHPGDAESMSGMAGAGRHGGPSLIDWHVGAYQERAGLIDTAQADRRMPSGQPECEPRSSTSPRGAFSGALACKRIIYAHRPMSVDLPPDRLVRRVADLTEPFSLAATFHDLPSTADRIEAGFPALTVIVRGDGSGDPPSVGQLITQSHRIAARLRRALRVD